MAFRAALRRVAVGLGQTNRAFSNKVAAEACRLKNDETETGEVEWRSDALRSRCCLLLQLRVGS
jgi:hypothetical protein